MKKADHLHRAIAKAIDFLLVGIAAKLSWAGVLGGALYILIADGFHGQSLGKRLIGLRVIVDDPPKTPHPALFRESILRNAVFGLLVVLSSLGLILGTLFFVFLVVFVAAETYFIYMDDRGIRIGDIFAGTRVIEEAKDEAEA
ncbi:MAG: RDD family protein [Pseudomonadota bacterium]